MLARHSFHTIRKHASSFLAYRKAARELDETYPTVESDELCVICHETLSAGGKQLPCGHSFHSRCLLDWIHQNPSCPTCRFSLPVAGASNAPPASGTADGGTAAPGAPTVDGAGTGANQAGQGVGLQHLRVVDERQFVFQLNPTRWFSWYEIETVEMLTLPMELMLLSAFQAPSILF